MKRNFLFSMIFRTFDVQKRSKLEVDNRHYGIFNFAVDFSSISDRSRLNQTIRP
jgi:hypothetical protein